MFTTRLLGALLALIVGVVCVPYQEAISATTGLDFAGGCAEGMSPNNMGGGLCAGGANADVDNVSAILGVDASLVTQVSGGFTISGIGAKSGTWAVTDPTITHLAFKANGYFILGALSPSAPATGDWMLNANQALTPLNWDLSLAICPASICDVADGGRPIGPRAYVEADFLNNGGNVADLSNVRAFSVVPLPAAVWLFGSGLLGLVAVARQRKAA